MLTFEKHLYPLISTHYMDVPQGYMGPVHRVSYPLSKEVVFVEGSNHETRISIEDTLFTPPAPTTQVTCSSQLSHFYQYCGFLRLQTPQKIWMAYLLVPLSDTRFSCTPIIWASESNFKRNHFKKCICMKEILKQSQNTATLGWCTVESNWIKI